jgi:hypothetical protein
MINAIEDASNNKLSGGVAITAKLFQQRSTYAAAGQCLKTTIIKNVIEALSYDSFIFIVVLALLLMAIAFLPIAAFLFGPSCGRLSMRFSISL